MKKSFFVAVMSALLLASCAETPTNNETQYVYIPGATNCFYEARSEAEKKVELPDKDDEEAEYQYYYPFFEVENIDYSNTGLIDIYYWTVDYRCDYKINAKDEYTPRIIGDLNCISVSEFTTSAETVYVFTGIDPLTQTNLKEREFIHNYTTQEEAEEFDKAHNTIHWDYRV